MGSPPRDLTTGERQCWIDLPFFEAILDLIRGRSDVQVTFDDSNESDHAIALPALIARNMVAKFFVVAQRVDQNGYLSKGQLEALVSVGMTIGNHGMRHRCWTKLNDRDLHEELVEAKDRLEQITQTRVSEAACPFGSYDRRVLRALRNLSYTRVYTSDGGPVCVDSVIQPRNTVLWTHDVPQIERIIGSVPHGLHKTWRNVKLTLKQWR